MCRIVGSISGYNPDLILRTQSALDSLAHGGPDDEGIFVEGNVILGHRRLSIIDLSSAGHQPMTDQANELVITYNGEIYNYQELKQELVARGVTFATKTDTEVILQAYKEWGNASFDRLQGIFAFSIFDKKKQKLILVRDHVGVKPLYYSFWKGQFIFSSEVRAFRAFDQNWPENKNWRPLFLAFGSMPFPFTTLKDVFALKPGCWMEVDVNRLTSNTECFNLTKNDISHETSESLVNKRVTEALRKNLISDAPLGVFLSGGIDSSLLTLLADEYVDGLNAISINFDEAQFDEHPFQKMVFDKTKRSRHVSHFVTEKMFWDSLPDIWRAMDQPTADGVNSYFVAKCAHQNGLKVVLSGLGADELFGGYASFQRITWMRRLRSLPFKDGIAKLLSLRNSAYRRVSFLKLPGTVGDYLFLRGIHTMDAISAILQISEREVTDALSQVTSDFPSNLNDHEYASLLESHFYMTNQLLRDMDVMGMWHALEVRVPFLDIELIRAIHSIDIHNQTQPKKLLTDSFPGILPNEVIYRKKQGFTFPISIWMMKNQTRFMDLIDSNKSTKAIVSEFSNGKSHWSKSWSLAVLNQFNKW